MVWFLRSSGGRLTDRVPQLTSLNRRLHTPTHRIVPAVEPLEPRYCLNAAPGAVRDSYLVLAGESLTIGNDGGGTEVALIEAGSTWRYLDDGSNQGTLWHTGL